VILKAIFNINETKLIDFSTRHISSLIVFSAVFGIGLRLIFDHERIGTALSGDPLPTDGYTGWLAISALVLSVVGAYLLFATVTLAMRTIYIGILGTPTTSIERLFKIALAIALSLVYLILVGNSMIVTYTVAMTDFRIEYSDF
jgi:hypothetical protein